VALGVTFTRSAWIALALECGVIAGAVWPLALVGIAGLIAAAFAFAPGAYRVRLWSMFDPHHPWNQQRVYMWQAGVRMFRDHPVTGVGLQDLHALYDRYRSPLATERAGHLHNVFVQIAAQMGVVGLAAFAWLYASFFRAAGAGLAATRRRRGFAAGIQVGVIAALAGFLVAGLFEWNFGDEELLYSLYTLVGIAWAARAWDRDPAGEGAPRVALVHDWLVGMRGGERVLERIARLFPGAPIYTLVWRRGGVSRELESHPVHTSFLQRLPFPTKLYRWYLPLYRRAIEAFDFSGFDAIVSTSHAVAKGALAPAGAPHLCYVHTPMRYIWELEDSYFPRERFRGPVGAYVRDCCARLRRWDEATANRPTALIANSAFVAGRIRRHWHRDAAVIHPCVAIERFTPREAPRTYFLLGGALAPYKRVDLALEAFGRTGAPLKLVGRGQEYGRLARLRPPNATFVEAPDDRAMAGLLEGARAFVFPGEEDFGILPVEAMAAGTPVIAYGRGGALETVGRAADAAALATVAAGGCARVPGGVLFGTQSVDGILAALACFERERFEPQALRAFAEPFSGERFDREIRAALIAAGIPPQA
ncbi:MAG TPA: O-antigen ligase family protein, partial [Candidatus Acidoferrales bacterium]|nr:O-antigen ligase family protein [Candidatus Acidoferrales bacterium]